MSKELIEKIKSDIAFWDRESERCKKCPDHDGLCELSGDHPIVRFEECDLLQERF
jgi:hypothetical protein